jgi:hypothetical protein
MECMVDNLSQDYKTGEVYAASHCNVLSLMAAGPSNWASLANKLPINKKLVSSISKLVEWKEGVYYGKPLKEQVLVVDDETAGSKGLSAVARVSNTEWMAGSLLGDELLSCKLSE